MKGNGGKRAVNMYPNFIKPSPKKKQKARGTGAAKKGCYTRGPMA